ncbi:hypothetical protein PF004_g22276 [Phytophthora fragariae]|uniref:RxLR effector protein n=1 Tax=Phytophthora fragariae TaxID=53985 RepID=A0A6A3GU12_9STRA|nr:hypothetical protein PF011_g30077 [Phytophthora fragariae]KAE9189223.1 hypothetical protein PF004_g22276 [Phytophthora fragariae]
MRFICGCLLIALFCVPPRPAAAAAAAAAVAAAALPVEARHAGAREHLIYIGPDNSLASHKVTNSCSYWTKQLLPLKKWNHHYSELHSSICAGVDAR